MTDKPDNRRLRGFASMDPERRREIARKGGAAIPSHKRSFSTNRELAQAAGAKGGAAGRKTEAAE